MKCILFYLVFALSAAAQTFTSTPLSSDVSSAVAVWNMQEGSGNIFSDSSGNANTASAGGSVVWESGPGAMVSGAHFDGTFDTITSGFASFNPGSSSAWSLSAWVSFDATDNNTEMLFAQRGTSGQGWYLFRYPANTQYRSFGVVLTNAGGGFIHRGFSLLEEQAGFLYHIVLTVDGSGTAKGVNLWINGSFAQSWTISDALSGSMTPDAPLYLASFPTGGSLAYPASTIRHAGFFSSIRIYGRVLANREVLMLYEAGPVSDSYLKASVSGTVVASNFASLDADCVTGSKIGGGSPTDNTAKFNAILLAATATNPITLDLSSSGGCSATKGLLIPQDAASVTIQGNGWRSGLFVLAGSMAAAVTNGWGLYPVSINGYGVSPIVLPAQNGNFILKNLRINGNRGGGNVVGSDPRGGNSQWIPGVALSNVSALTLDTVFVYDAPTYALIVDNVSNVLIKDSRVEAPSMVLNTDGWHVDGPADHITISGGYLKTGDDAIALNAPEGYSGVISNVTISGVNVDAASFNGLKEYGTVDTVTLNNCVLANTVNLPELSAVRLSAATVDATSCAPPPPPPTGRTLLHGSISVRGAIMLH